MKIYINSSASVSAKSHPLPNATEANALRCADPDLAGIIDPKLSRRMSHVVKMGIDAALRALKNAGIEKPDAIITGTAYGCLDDTGVFLKKQVTQQEQMLTPTAFIQSTHNTVGGQIGLMLQCNGYNNTIVHRGFSFEHSLHDAMMQLQDNEANYILAGASDEITNYSHDLLSRFNLYKQVMADGSLSKDGTIAGEGAAYFVLTNQQSESNIGIIKSVHTFYKPVHADPITTEISKFLQKNELAASDIDQLLFGVNDDASTDAHYRQLATAIFPGKEIQSFKKDCGDHPTATAYALHKAVESIKDNKSDNIKNILIYNHFQNIHHSLILLRSC